MINESFRTVLEKFKPRNIFVPGCTIGNGFEYINWKKVERVTAVDVNPHFLKVLRERFPGEEKLELIAGDFDQIFFNSSRYDLIFSALFFEYVEIKSALYKFREMMNDTSTLFSIIQLPDPGQSKVSKSKYKSLEKLGPHITLITTDEFSREINQAGLKISKSTKMTLANGKSFLLSESVKNKSRDK